MDKEHDGLADQTKEKFHGDGLSAVWFACCWQKKKLDAEKKKSFAYSHLPFYADNHNDAVLT